MKEKLTTFLKETAPVIWGAGLAGLAKILDLPPELLVLPPIAQISQRYNPYFTKKTKPSIGREIWNISKYSIGAMLPYTPEIYDFIQSNLFS